MDKFWLVAKHEYLKTVRRRAFLLATLGVPALIVLVIVVAIVVAVGAPDTRPAGYVDQSGVLASGIQPTFEDPKDAVELRAFPDEASARAALERREIQAFYVLPATYRQTRSVEVYYWDKAPGDRVRRAFDALIRANLLAGLPAQSEQRLMDGSQFAIRSADGRREIAAGDFMSFLLPFAAGFFFVFAVMMSAGYLLQVVTDEKENRTIEIAMTTLSPLQLIGGKSLGLMGVALTQLVIWVVAVVIGLLIGGQFVPELRSIAVPWAFIGVAMLYFFPSYALIAGMMTAIGSAVTESRQGQQIAGVLNMLFVLPYFFTAVMISNPNSPLLTVLTLFPTTSFISVTMRWGMTIVPTWQLVTSWLLLVATAALSIWVASRVFRAGMLRYGQELSLRGVVDAVRGQAG